MFQAHRRAFLDSMQEGDIALFAGACHVTRNHDVDFPFRQDSDYYYLTGHRESDGLLMLAKGLDGIPEETIFVLPRDPKMETWFGVRLGSEGAPEALGIACARVNTELAAAIADAMQKCTRIWYRLGGRADVDAMVMKGFAHLRTQVRKGFAPPTAVLEPTHVLHEMRLFKSPAEMDVMRRAAALSAKGHNLAMAMMQPGMMEYEVEAFYNYTFRRAGAESMGWSYGTIVAGGDHANILHYVENDKPLNDGELVLVDAGAEFGLYAGDITRTYPVNGKFTDAQKEVYAAVLAAEKASIAASVVGATLLDVHNASVQVLCSALITLGVTEDSVEKQVASESYKEWFLHNTSHWIGLDVHDAGKYRDG
ncbi:MAG: M24 family metallopeptidase, partial [Planctomycetes bacterium]|nr:M24 family metallopeptidase [Planctomycetota bacterium]